MDYERYLRHYASMASYGLVKLHLCFDLTGQNAEYRAEEIEKNAKEFVQRPYPGLSYFRHSARFSMDAAAYGLSGHLDYFDRMLSLIVPRDDVRIVSRRLIPSSREVLRRLEEWRHLPPDIRRSFEEFLGRNG
ncbi:MAG: hypothetical protein HY368_00820 [Candidatus Aenigmarchaeota archaeon]|nr:hypothetical protein [Candidatus Aenigmarchaeota archaeon]